MADVLSMKCSQSTHQQHDAKFRESRRDSEYLRLLEDDKATDVLVYGLNTREAQIVQMDAFVSAQRKIENRTDTARALLVSANVFTMAVMSSQLAMHRWKVSEAQTLTDATAILEEQVARAKINGFMETQSCVGSRRSKTGTQGRRPSALSFANSPADEMGGPAAETADTEDAGGRAISPCSSVCSAEGGVTKKTLMPPDMVSRLVIIDTFTHEPFSDIVEHLRFLDFEYNLDLVIVLMLYENYSHHVPGILVLPKHTTTLTEAYKFGCDLVLLRSFDHRVVEFLTDMFISATGRWRNDVRHNLAVGNYHSIRQIFSEKLLSDFKHGEHQEQGELKCDDILARLSPSSTLMVSRNQGSPVGSGSYRQHSQAQPSTSLSFDAISRLMHPAENVKHALRSQLRSANGVSDGGSEGAEMYEETLVDEADEMESALVAACQREIARLLSEIERSSSVNSFLREEIAKLQESLKLQQLRRRHSSNHSISESNEGAEMCGNLNKEQQIHLLKRRVQELGERLSAYEDVQGEMSRFSRRDNSVKRSGVHVGILDLPEDDDDDDDDDDDEGGRGGKRGGKRHEQLLRPYDSVLSRHTEALEAMLMESEDVNVNGGDSGGGTRGKTWYCRPARDSNDLVSTLRNEIALLKDEQLKKNATSDDNNNVSEQLKSRFLGMQDLVDFQKKRIAQLEESLEGARKCTDGGKRKSVKKGAEHVDKPHIRGSERKKKSSGLTNISTDGKKKKANRRGFSGDERGSAWNDDMPGYQLAMAKASGNDNSDASGRRGWEKLMKAENNMEIRVQLKRLREEMNEQRMREIELVEAQAQARERARAKAATKAREALVQLHQALDDVSASEGRNDHEAAEKARAKARLLASEYAANQHFSENVGHSARRNFSEPLGKLHDAHTAALKTAEEMLIGGCTSTSYAQAVMAVHAAEQDLKRQREVDTKGSVAHRTTTPNRKGIGGPHDYDHVNNDGKEKRDVMGEQDWCEGEDDSNSEEDVVPAHHQLQEEGGPRAMHHFIGRERQREIQGEIGAYARTEHATPLVLLCRAALNELHPLSGIHLQMIGEQLRECCRASSNDDSNTSNSSSGNRADSSRDFNELYLSHHRVLLQLLHAVSEHHLGLQSVMQYETAELEAKIARELRDNGAETKGDRLSARFLMAIDTALLSRFAALLDGDTPLSYNSELYEGVNAAFVPHDGGDDHDDFSGAENLAKRMGKESIAVDEIPQRFLDLISEANTHEPSVDGDMANQVRRELMKIQEKRQKRMEAAAEAVRQRRLLFQKLNNGGISGDSSNSSASDDDDDVSQSVGRASAGTATSNSVLRRVLSASKYRTTVPMAKRHAVLRRRQLPGQYLFSANLQGDVAVEVSKRLSHPKFRFCTPTELGDEDIEGTLPPMQSRGLSRAQQKQLQQRQKQIHRQGQIPSQLSTTAGVGSTMGAHYPRFNGSSVTDMANVDLSPFSPEELAERIMSYRLENARSHTTHRLDACTTVLPTFAIPVAAAALRPYGEVHPGPMHCRGTEKYTSWVYGVPREHLFPMLRSEEPNKCNAVVFLPGVAHGTSRGDTRGDVTVHTVCSSFVKRMLKRMDLFASPAAMAAQRLNEQLRTSISDWRMGIIGTTLTPATRRTQQQEQKKEKKQ